MAGRSDFLKLLALSFLIPIGSSWAMVIGNPAQPVLQKEGVILSNPSWLSVRVGYLDDYVYRAQFKDEFRFPGVVATASYAKLSTNAALITVNFKNTFDLYGIVGASKLLLDKEVYTKQQPCWGVGGKFIFLRSGAFRMGADFKYFETDQKPSYFVSEGLAYNVTSDFTLCYWELQAAVGMAYRIPLLSPYIQLTYLISKLEPRPYVVSVRLPYPGMADSSVDIVSKSVIGKRRWGMAIGATIISNSRGSLTVESRLFNQNAVDVTGEIRF